MGCRHRPRSRSDRLGIKGTAAARQQAPPPIRPCLTSTLQSHTYMSVHCMSAASIYLTNRDPRSRGAAAASSNSMRSIGWSPRCSRVRCAPSSSQTRSKLRKAAINRAVIWSSFPLSRRSCGLPTDTKCPPGEAFPRQYLGNPLGGKSHRRASPAASAGRYMDGC